MKQLVKIIRPLGALALVYLGIDLVINPDAIAEPFLRWSMGFIVTLVGLVQVIEVYKDYTNK